MSSYLSTSGISEDLTTALKTSGVQTVEAFKNLNASQWLFQYAPDKWTPGMILQHLIDTERIFAYRALRFSRGDNTALQGFDENQYACGYKTLVKDATATCQAFLITRASTVQIFEECTPEMFGLSGIANNRAWTVNDLGWAIVNHNKHHVQILQTRYLHL